MTYFVAKNLRTGWEGSVTEKMYHRLKRDKDYQVRAVSRNTIPVSNADQNRLPDLDRVGTGVSTYRKARRGGGWYDVVDEKGDVLNEKGLREADADALLEKLKGE